MTNQSKYNMTKFDSHVTVFDKNVQGIRFTGKKGVSFNKADTLKIVNDGIKKDLRDKNKNVKLMLTIDNHHFGWRSGKSFGLADDAQVFDPSIYDYNEDWSDIKDFIVYVIPQAPRAGGKDKYNDCLYLAIVKGLHKIDERIAKPSLFKKFLLGDNYKREALISVDIVINKLQQRLHTRINIVGDYTYTSDKNFKPLLKIKLTNGHYTLAEHRGLQLKEQKWQHKFMPKCFLIYERIKKSTLLNCYNGSEYVTKTHEDFLASYIVPEPDEVYIKAKAVKTYGSLETQYHKYIADCIKLSECTGGVIDPRRNYGSVKLCALNYLFYCTKNFPDPEPMTENESVWYDNCQVGALMYAKKNTAYTKAYLYDQKSAYAHKLLKKWYVPWKQGTFKTLENLNDYLKTGIYRAVISKSNNEDTDKLFRFNFKNYYTQYDIWAARKLGLKIELIQDDIPNALIYERDECIRIDTFFWEYINTLYKLKVEGLAMAKELLVIIWGALCQRKHTIKTTVEQEVYAIPIDEEIVELTPFGEGSYIKTANNNNLFLYPHARMGSFLLAHQRMCMTYTMLENKKDIVQINTDGFISTKEIKTFKDNTKEGSGFIGDWRLQKQGSLKLTDIKTYNFL